MTEIDVVPAEEQPQAEETPRFFEPELIPEPGAGAPEPTPSEASTAPPAPKAKPKRQAAAKPRAKRQAQARPSGTAPQARALTPPTTPLLAPASPPEWPPWSLDQHLLAWYSSRKDRESRQRADHYATFRIL